MSIIVRSTGKSGDAYADAIAKGLYDLAVYDYKSRCNHNSLGYEYKLDGGVCGKARNAVLILHRQGEEAFRAEVEKIQKTWQGYMNKRTLRNLFEEMASFHRHKEGEFHRYVVAHEWKCPDEQGSQRVQS
ncbi:MAG: hypothetical protein OXF02_00375 [Simkaniaceae bacterium]|nr:hypothetical protein [Simkaniaceae bacterium]